MTTQSPGRAWTPTLGAVPAADGAALFRVWAPRPAVVELVLYGAAGEERVLPMERDGEYWTANVVAGAGSRYKYRLDNDAAYPDPCSRRQPEGVHGPSEVVRPSDFAWTDEGWTPPAVSDLSFYECHIGTLTPEGTFDSAVSQLRRIRELGVTAVEVMPIASFAGRWNWGYDGVALYAPAEPYGGPEDFRQFVDAAHGVGLAVVLDVVYNHFGPSGNYTSLYSERYLTEGRHTPWGDVLNFDGAGSAEVRRYFTENALHWVHEYHVDGFRFDATFGIMDTSTVHYLAELASTLEEHSRTGSKPYTISETHENDVKYFQPQDEGGYNWDAVWADDFHHIVRTTITHEDEGYYANYGGSDDDLGRVIVQGFFYKGQVAPASDEPRGTPARDQALSRFVYCIQNHDQIGNRAFGQRLNTTASHADYFAASLLLLLLPQSPLIFQGQEFLASTPFLYFTDHEEELGALITEGRRKEFAGFAAYNDPAVRELIPDPQAEETFRRSRLNLEESKYGAGLLCTRYYTELLRLRNEDPVLKLARTYRAPITAESRDGSVVVQIETELGRRAIAANFRDKVERKLPDAERYRVVIHTAETRWAGNDRGPELGAGKVVLQPHSAAFLALE